ncbi:MAG: glutamate-1-semialdehyde 2,1-aminomutase [Dehalococcoidales bacterium]|nr:glutamate-1-semialdehyde 2,1-aminomutase [Dehalococcoidales bacterium]MDP7310338.1 glutamate-1-semialdehyde 2,1-aminomutase [Dehalococcoidales bacterium]MDP7409954.1 glutamate-1-semialdehyde 2,1-aminomutase [Dehalococcoidales bacterium]MDP7675411.1 glutamate-1-semialdehyde 2,1-aminomutase [Dehalococcoidales bacterium]
MPMKKSKRSQRLFAEAQRYLPGGVNSPVRSFKAVGGTPPFIIRGKGSKIYDTNDNEFIDYVNSWGPLVLGHAHPPVVAALKRATEQGTSFGAPTELETTLAKMISAATPSIEMLRFVSSGTEATMTALRLARAFTSRDKIIKFAGSYHGHADGLLAKGGSGLATLCIPDSPGVPSSYTENTLIAPYNNVDAVEELFHLYPEQIAAVIVEPVAANMGVISPQPAFLTGLRELTKKSSALLIFDEVITGFRLAYGGAQTLFKITPDLTCLGKIIGGGLPVGAYGGRRDIMSLMAPLGPVYQAGTLSGNPLVMTAGIETLKALNQPGVYAQLETKSATLEKGIAGVASEAGIGLYISRAASLLTTFFTPGKVVDYESAKKADTELFARFFWHLLNEGIYWPSSQFEAAFVSLAHSDEEIQCTIEAISRALVSLRT